MRTWLCKGGVWEGGRGRRARERRGGLPGVFFFPFLVRQASGLLPFRAALPHAHALNCPRLTLDSVASPCARPAQGGEVGDACFVVTRVSGEASPLTV